MIETAPAAGVDSVLVSMEKPIPENPVGLTGVSRKTPSASVSKLITEALLVSQERGSMSLAALKKSLAVAGYDVEKNNSRIKLGLKSLVSKGILVQTRGTGASGSFKLSKKAAAPEPTKGKVKKPASTKTKKLVLGRDSKSPKNVKPNRRVKTPKTAVAAQKAGSGRKAKDAKSKQQRKSPTEAGAGKPKAGNPKLTQH